MLGQGRCGQMSYANIYYESLDQFIKIMRSLVFKGPELNVRSLLHCIQLQRAIPTPFSGYKA